MGIPRILRNKRIISYIFGFLTLALLLSFNLKNLYTDYDNDIRGEIILQQLLAARGRAEAIEKDIGAIVHELKELSRYLSCPSHRASNPVGSIDALFSGNSTTQSPEQEIAELGAISIRWLDPGGEELYQIGLTGDSLSSSEPVKMALLSPSFDGEKTFQVIGPHLSQKGIHTLWLTVPVKEEETDGSLGVIAAEIDIDRLIDCSYDQGTETGEGRDLFIIDEKGRLIYSFERQDMFMKNVLEPDKECFQCHKDFEVQRRMVREAEGWGNWETPDESDLVSFTPLTLGDTRWSVALAFPDQPLTALIGRFRTHFSVMIIIVLSLIGLLVFAFADLNRKKLLAEEQARYLQQRNALLREKKEMDRRYIELVESANDAIYIKHKDRFVLVNQAWEELTGYSREELLSPDFDIPSLISPEDKDYIRERAIRHEMGKPMEPTYEFRMVRKDGKEVDVEVSVTYIQYEGKPAVQGVIRDLSERKREEKQKELMLSLTETIRENRDLHELAKNSLECVTKILDMSTSTLYIHDEEKNELQLIAHTDIEEGILSIQERYNLSEEEKGVAVMTALQQEIITVDDMATSPLLSYIPDRSTLRGKSLISIPLNSQNVLLGVLQLAQYKPRADWSPDLTNLRQIANAIAVGLHRRKISSELAESERRLKHLFENSVEVIYSTTPEGHLKEINKAGLELFGDKKGDRHSGDGVVEFWKSKKQQKDYVEKMKRDGFIKDTEMKYLCRDGKVHTFLESSVAMRGENGLIVEFQGMMKDITSLKKAEEEMRLKNIELERVNAELRELDLMKDNFIATISHELRTPLTSIKGSIDLLLKGMVGKLDKKKEEILTICSRNSERLITLVNDLLEIQHLESGREELELQPIEIEDLIPKVIEKATSDTNKKGIRLMARISPESHGRVIMADRSKISHAMFNLLTNALKFSDKGTVMVEVAYHNGEVHLSVADEGIGIPEEMREKIFDKFTQADGGMTRKQGGTGLGLAITRTIIEKHGGRIWVESKEGAGSKFTFSLPCYPKNDDDEQQGEGPGGKG